MPASGDVNKDGELTVDDVSLILREIAEQLFGESSFEEWQFAVADFDQNDELTVDDASGFLKRIAEAMF